MIAKLDEHEKSCVADGMCRCQDCVSRKHVKQGNWPFKIEWRCMDKTCSEFFLRLTPELWRRCSSFKPKRALVKTYMEARNGN